MKSKMIHFRSSLMVALMLAFACSEPCRVPSENAPKICTYFEPLFTEFQEYAKDYKDLLKMWEESWALQGWQPVILRETDAKRHPKYAENVKALEKLPSRNSRKYELACYLRWFAAVEVGCGSIQSRISKSKTI
jgi:hypothetical protein